MYAEVANKRGVYVDLDHSRIWGVATSEGMMLVQGVSPEDNMISVLSNAPQSGHD